MLNLTNYVNSRIFLYGSIAHTSLYVFYFLYHPIMSKIRNIKGILSNLTIVIYFLAHISISSAMIDRVNVNNIGNFFSTVTGVIGHSFLLLYGIANPKINNKLFNNWDYMFILGQLGMIMLYINLYRSKNKYKKYHYYKIYSLTFFLLFTYYMHSVSKNINISKVLSCGLFLVGILYLVFCINELYRYYTNKFIKKKI